MNADDRKLLKKLIDRDASRALVALDHRQRKAIDKSAQDVLIAELPAEARGIVLAVQASLEEIGVKMERLREHGFQLEDSATSFRGYDQRVGQVRRVPVIRVVEVTSEAKTAKEHDIRADFRPKRAAIEEAQSVALMNVVAQDLPGVREELDKLRATIAQVVGPIDEE